MKKTIKNYCLNTTDRKLNELYEVALRYANVKNEVFKLYGSLEGLRYLGYPRRARDKWVREEHAEKFHLQARLWKCAFEEAFGNIKTSWEQTFIKVRRLLYNNPNFTEEEKHYCFYLLKATDLLYQALRFKSFDLPHTFEDKDIDVPRCHRYLKRQLRRHRSKRSLQKRRRSFVLDGDMYNYFEDKNGRLWLAVMGLNPRKRIRLNLTSTCQFTGNIRLLLKGRRIEIHAAEELTPPPQNNNTKAIAIDKGFTDLLTTSQETKYGSDFNVLLTQESDRLSKKNARRNKLRALTEKYTKQNNLKKAQRIQRHNLRKRKYNRQRTIEKNRISDFINHSLNLFFKEERPDILVVESLKLSNFNKKLSKKVKRYFSSWLKGYLQKRIEYKCQENSVLLGEVNPAYTSQVCNPCRSLNTIRMGDRLYCRTCGRDVDAHYNASLNILSRYRDPDIGLYTPYKRVRYILEERFSHSVETGQPGVEIPSNLYQGQSDSEIPNV